jgi:UDP-glucuronate 4-epimerase
MDHSKTVLITGAAGFIGFFLCQKLLERGDKIIGIDNLNDYYDPNLKYARLKELGVEKKSISDNIPCKSLTNDRFSFVKMDISDIERMNDLFEIYHFDVVCNLAAQAGVRYSIENPMAYINSNIIGFTNVLQECRKHNIGHLVYASSSSVYGLNKNVPFSTKDTVAHPVSLYAASKKSNELMAHTYSHLFNIPTTGLRFFTVYGPWGRPDMAYFLFTKAILNNEPIKVFNEGKMERDFTFIDDIVEGIVRVIDNPPSGNPDWNPKSPEADSSTAPYKIYNIGNNAPVNLMEFITTIEKAIGKEAVKKMLPMQPGDVEITFADIQTLIDDLGYQPKTTVKDGISEFIKWYKNYYK